MGIGSCNKFNNTMNVDVVCCVVSTVDILMWLLVFLSLNVWMDGEFDYFKLFHVIF